MDKLPQKPPHEVAELMALVGRERGYHVRGMTLAYWDNGDEYEIKIKPLEVDTTCF